MHPRPQLRLTVLAAAAIAVAGLGPARGQNSGPWVSPTAGGLVYRVRPDTNPGDRIPDFSAVGFGAGLVPIPTVPAVITLSPVAGDNTAHIQAALNQVATLPLGPDGFRGAVQLTAGKFDIAGQLRIEADGVVLRGVGRGESTASNTVLVAQGESTRSLIQIQGASKRHVGSTYQVADDRVPVGATSMTLANTTGLAVGHTVTVNRPHSAQWVTDAAMATYWDGQTRSLNWDRVITRIEGNTVHFDAPLTTALEARYGGGTLRRYEPGDRIRHVGVENLRGHSLDARDQSNEARAWSFITVRDAEHVFARNIKSMYFPYSSVHAAGGAKWVTVDNAHNHSPSGQVTGGRRYAFNVSTGGELVLVQNSDSRDGRHDYVTGSEVAGPVVFFNSTASSANSETGPHHRWASGLLFDNLSVSGDEINIHNRGSYGTGHGWAGANSVVWNSSADGFAIQNPPTAQNWLIGSTGTRVTGSGFVFPGAAGFVESHGQRVSLGDPVNNPLDSLYIAQLNERQATGTQLRFWVGDQGPGWAAAAPAGWTNWSSTRGIRTNASAPGPQDDVVFAVTGTAPVATSPGGPLTVSSLQFDAAAAPVTVNLDAATNRLTLGSRGITVFSGSHAIVGAAGSGTDLGVEVSQTWEIRGTSALTVNARIGPGTTAARTVTKAGTGTLTLAANSGGTGAFKADWVVEAGTLRLGHAAGMGWSQNPVTVAAGATLELDGVGLGQSNAPVSLAGTGSDGGGALRSLSGNVALAAGSGRLELAAGSVGIAVVGGTLTIHQPTEGPGRLAKTGSGTLVLTGLNTFTGGTTLAAGTLVAGAPQALGTGAVTVEPGATLRLAGGVAVSNLLALAGGELAFESPHGSGPGAGLVAGTAASPVTLSPTVAWSPRTAGVVSDVLGLTGTAGSIQILSVAYDPAALGGVDPASLMLGWRSGDAWVNAVAGNLAAPGAAALFGQTGGFASLGVTPSAVHLGSWGHDPATNSVWAVIDHNSQFAVTPVPEPGLLAAAALALLAALRRHRRARLRHA